jgi:hypothetical protein
MNINAVKTIGTRVAFFLISIAFLSINQNLQPISNAADTANLKNRVEAYWSSNTKELVMLISVEDNQAIRSLKASEFKGFRIQIYEMGINNNFPSTPVLNQIVQSFRKADANGYIFYDPSKREKLTWTRPKAGAKYAIQVAITTAGGDGPVSQSEIVQVDSDFIFPIKPTKNDPKSWQYWQLISDTTDEPLFQCRDNVGNGCSSAEMIVSDAQFVKDSRFIIGRAEYLRIACNSDDPQKNSICTVAEGYPPIIYFEIQTSTNSWKVLEEIDLDSDGSLIMIDENCAANQNLCTGLKKVRLRNNFGVLANFSFNFGGNFNPVGQKCTKTGEVVEFGLLRENGKSIFTKKAICTLTKKGKVFVEKAVKLLPYCSGAQEAGLINLRRQTLALSQLRNTYQMQKQKAELQYQNAMATGNQTAARLAQIDINSWQSKIDEVLNKMNTLDSQKENVTAKCRLKDENATGATTAPTTKKVACNSSERSSLNLLASQYATKQNLIKVSDESYGKFAELYKLEVSNGRLDIAAKYQIQMESWYKRIQEDSTAAILIKSEFDAINSGCTGSGVSLPAKYVFRYAK